MLKNVYIETLVKKNSYYNFYKYLFHAEFKSG